MTEGLGWQLGVCLCRSRLVTVVSLLEGTWRAVTALVGPVTAVNTRKLKNGKREKNSRDTKKSRDPKRTKNEKYKKG